MASGEEDGGMWATGCGGHGGDTWPLWPRSWWDWYETLTTYWFVLWRPEERERERWPVARRPHLLLRSCRPAPAHLVCNLPILVREREGGIIRNYHQQPHFRAVTSTSAWPRPLWLEAGRIHLRNIDNNTRLVEGGEDASCVTRTG